MVIRSNDILIDINRAPQRAYLNALGLSKQDFQKPFVAVVNEGNEAFYPPAHTARIIEAVKAGILASGGIPFEINTIGAFQNGKKTEQRGHSSDSMPEFRHSHQDLLCYRELIADSIETMVEGHRLDGMVILATGDTAIAAGLMALFRLDLPALLLNCGPYSLESLDSQNTMACIAEALGLSLPGSALVLSTSAKKLRQARTAGQLVCKMIKNSARPGGLITESSFQNAMAVGAALGGSPDFAMHLIAIAREAGLTLSFGDFLSMKDIPTLCTLQPDSFAPPDNIDGAGGIPALMLSLGQRIITSAATVTGKTVRENINGAEILNSQLIRSPATAFSPLASLLVMEGNLCPGGALVKQTPAVTNSFYKGTAKCFDSEDQALAGLADNRINPGDIVVLRYLGPKGGAAASPGMPPVSRFIYALHSQGLADKLPILSDGRFAAFTNSPYIGCISPEAALGGPLALVEDGDNILIDLPRQQLSLLAADEELARRRQKRQDRQAALKQPPLPRGYLERYYDHVSGAENGAVLV